MNARAMDQCCPRFDPAPWDEKEICWQGKRFVKDRVRCFVHIPLNFGAVMRRNMARIQAANAASDQNVILSDDNSLWGADVYIEVSKDVPGANMAAISGTFLSKVFEGPYRNIRAWIRTMREFVRREGKDMRKLYILYTTCPKCAREYGKNYVALLAEV